jgi:hypothetical protein
MTGVQLLELTTFTFVLWLGCYLIARDYRKPLTRYAGLGSIAYAVVLAVSFLSTLPDSPSYFVKLSWSILFFPPFFWSSAITHLENERSDDSPEELPARNSVALMGTLSVSIALFLLPILWENDLGRPSTLGLALLSIWLAAPLINTARTLIRISKSNTTALVGIRAVLISTVFFTLGSGFVLFPLKIIPAEWVLLAIALDFELLGLAVAWLDAFRLGERLIPDFSRSLIVSIFLSARAAFDGHCFDIRQCLCGRHTGLR